MHRSEFIKAIKEQFPELRGPINQQEGLLHFETDQFRYFTQRAIRDGDGQKLGICFRLAEIAFATGNAALKNAIDVSFSEPMDFITPNTAYEWAWEMLPDSLKMLYTDFHGQIDFKRKKDVEFNLLQGALSHDDTR